jgi:glyoxylase I family protein
VKLTPLVQVFDMIESSRFYIDRLGFEIVDKSPTVETAEGQFSRWMWLRNAGVELMLNTAYDANERPPSRDDARELGHRDVGSTSMRARRARRSRARRGRAAGDATA